MADNSRVVPQESGEAFDLTPLIDIVFILLIFFLVATTLRVEETNLDLTLPAASEGAAAADSPTRATIAIDAQGRCFYERDLIPVDGIAARLEQDGVDEVIVRGDGAMAYQRIVDVIDQCYAADVKAVGLAALERRTR